MVLWLVYSIFSRQTKVKCHKRSPLCLMGVDAEPPLP
nr:MAG TPA: hypothetical protein [Caudoviricetes sp.]